MSERAGVADDSPKLLSFVTVLGSLISDLSARLPGIGFRDPLLLGETQFNREVARERVRASRRSIPFCIITFTLNAAKNRREESRRLVRVLHRNLRMNDQKGHLGPGKFAVLLVDTPEMGGRSAMDRLSNLLQAQNLQAKIDLRVHDPNGFTPDDQAPMSDQRRRGGVRQEEWSAQDHEVLVTNDDPMVPHDMTQMVVKRVLDIVGASVGLIVASPLLLIAMALIRKQDGGPAVFTQTREGLRGKPFTIYKLRTMVMDAEKQQAELRHRSHRDGPAFKIDNDPRITSIGHILRRRCMDEVPQLWNVLKGDMSLVGPRPLPWHESRACTGWHRRRLDVRPGLTCYWQINKDSVQTFDDWMRLDLRYLDKISLIGDLRLIVQTFKVPILGRGSA